MGFKISKTKNTTMVVIKSDNNQGLRRQYLSEFFFRLVIFIEALLVGVFMGWLFFSCQKATNHVFTMLTMAVIAINSISIMVTLPLFDYRRHRNDEPNSGTNKG